MYDGEGLDSLANSEKTSRPGFDDWARLRSEVVLRDGERCVWCGAFRGLQLDHVRPVALGGANDAENLQLLCESCHLEKTRRDRLMISRTRRYKKYRDRPSLGFD